MRLLLLGLLCMAGSVGAESARFVGTTPAGEPVRRMLGIAAEAEVIEWELTLQEGRYELICSYGNTAAGSPGLARDIRTVRHAGNWTHEQGLYRLAGAGISLTAVSPDVLHLINADRTLMHGNSGWSYTLNRADRAETAVDPALTLSEPSASYTMSPLASGPDVFAVFEGRTPCHGIADTVRIPVKPGCMKAKWRITLYQDAATRASTTYKVEGSLHRQGARTGAWSVDGDIYRLAFEPGVAMALRRGAGEVLFLLSRDGQPLVGTRYFSYTLNRRL